MFSHNNVILNVAEKPSIAKQLAQEISSAFKSPIKKVNSFSIYNPVVELNNIKFRNDAFQNSNNTMLITSVSGHLTSFEFCRDLGNWRQVDPKTILYEPIKKQLQKKNDGIYRNLFSYSKKANILILWLDCDREGENICLAVRSACLSGNRNLLVFRATFSAITLESVLNALNNLGTVNESLASSVDVRQELDFRVGLAVSRFLTLHLVKFIKNITETNVISYGPCQFPTLALIIERYARCCLFTPEYYYNMLLSVYITDKESIDLQPIGDDCNYFDKVLAVLDYKVLLEKADHALVKLCETKNRTHKRPKPLNTLELCVKACKFLKVTSVECMEIAEKLYNHGYISYPRTETNMFTDNSIVKFSFGVVDQIPEYRSICARIKSRGILNISAGIKTDKAHPPIHPVGIPVNLTVKEKLLYDFICLHFLACLDIDAVIASKTITVSVNDHLFSASFDEMIQRGFLDFYHTYDSFKPANNSIGNHVELKVGLKLKLKFLKLIEHAKTSPEPLKESDLLILMDKYGIGTDATMHEHIANIIKRKYVVKENKNYLIPTKLGLTLSLIFIHFCEELIVVRSRSTLEESITKIANNCLDGPTFIKLCINNFDNYYDKLSNNLNTICEFCNQKMLQV